MCPLAWLATAARGDVDLVLVHDPEAERRFIAEGHGTSRREIAWNDFVIVGPASDPAHIGGGHDAATLSDCGTWLAFGSASNLRILVEGGPNLVNRYDVILLPPGQRPPGSEAAARRLADWLALPDGQSAIGGYEVAGQQLFHPSAGAAPF